MKEEDFEKTKIELKGRLDKEIEQIDSSMEKAKMADNNKFEHKALETVAFSMLPYLILFILTTTVYKTGFLGSLPVQLVNTAFIGGSLVLGNTIRVMINKKYKIKQRIEEFSKAKNEREKIEEQVKYTIEYEKARAKSNIVSQTYYLLNNNQDMINRISKDYDVYDKKINMSKVELQNNINDLSNILNNKYLELDALIAKKVLSDKFAHVRVEMGTIKDLLTYPFAGGIFAMLICDMPLLVFQSMAQNGSLFSVLAPLFVGTVTTGAYIVKRNNDYKKAFKSLNASLGEQSLPEKTKNPFEETCELENKIQKLSDEIIGIEAKIIEQKRLSESQIEDSDTKNQIQLLDKKITEEPKKEVLEQPKNTVDFSAILRTGVFYSEEDYEKYVDNVLSNPLLATEDRSKRLTFNKKNNK